VTGASAGGGACQVGAGLVAGAGVAAGAAGSGAGVVVWARARWLL